MAGELQSGMQCTEVEALLAEALDGTLQGAKLEAFEAHQQSCASCRTVIDEAKAGMLLLHALDEAEPPRNLVHNILAGTIGALPSEHVPAKPRGEGWLERLKGRLTPMFAPIATPRFAMSFGMAFFSITMLLGIAGFHFADIRHWDLSSKGIRKTYYETQARVMRYYENMRLVYEIESRVRDLRRAGTPDNDQTNQQQQQQQKQQEAPAPTPNQKNPSKTENRQQDRSTPTVDASRVNPTMTSSADIADLNAHAFRRAVTAPYIFQRASARAVPQARQKGPQQTTILSLMGPEERRTA